MDQPQIKKSFFRRFWWIGVMLIIILAVVGYMIYAGNKHNRELQAKNEAAKSSAQAPNTPEVTNQTATDKIIIANPVDLSQIVAISKFRSCFGHEFGKTSAFEGVEATSSLKNYFMPNPKYYNSNNIVVGYAPFDGVIIYTEEQTEQFLMEPEPFTGWVVAYTHVSISPGLQAGSKIKAGEVVGYSDLSSAKTFDISLMTQKHSGYNKQFYDWDNNYDSIFNHMTDKVYVEYVAHGITKENTIIAKSARDKTPCACQKATDESGKEYCSFGNVPYTDMDNVAQVK